MVLRETDSINYFFFHIILEIPAFSMVPPPGSALATSKEGVPSEVMKNMSKCILLRVS